MGSEDYCNVCQDGGQLICCSFCPRGVYYHRSVLIQRYISFSVFHAACRGLKSRDLKKSWHACHQHECWDCSRRTSDVGGMLFRCVLATLCFAEGLTIDIGVGRVLEPTVRIVFPRYLIPLEILCQNCESLHCFLHFSSRLIPAYSLLLNCRESQSAYYISCAHCKAMAEEDPQWKLEWDNTIRAAERALEEDRLLGENF